VRRGQSTADADWSNSTASHPPNSPRDCHHCPARTQRALGRCRRVHHCGDSDRATDIHSCRFALIGPIPLRAIPPIHPEIAIGRSHKRKGVLGRCRRVHDCQGAVRTVAQTGSFRHNFGGQRDPGTQGGSDAQQNPPLLVSIEAPGAASTNPICSDVLERSSGPVRCATTQPVPSSEMLP
jgi:hypothetical protein